ncbi:MAG: hypothetical protein ABIN24_05785 [Dyadobacter sp.]
MKIFFISILLFAAFQCQAQVYKSENFQPEIYLDSVKYGTYPKFEISQIATMSISKADDKAPNGRIYLKSKNPEDLHFLSISDISSRYGKNALTPTIYMLDNNILKEASTFRIDSAFILKVEIVKGSETDYLNAQFPDLTILNIITRTPENVAKENQIRIRGIETRHVEQPGFIRLRGVSTASM